MPTAVVTGAFSYTGHAVARSLLARGWRVRTLSNRAAPILTHDIEIPRAPLRFSDQDALVSFLRGADLLVNTYWIRYPCRGLSFDDAVANSAVLLASAVTAGVSRVTHVSVSNPSANDPLDYYRGKAQVEDMVRGLGISYAIVRPTLIVGPRDVLINNIAWFLRRFPAFAMPGSGAYGVQPVTLDDVGEIVAEAAGAGRDVTWDAAGPDIVTFENLVRAVASAVGRPRPVGHLPPRLVLTLLRGVGVALREVVLSRQELEGLMAERLVSREPPRGRSSVMAWIAAHGGELGRSYASEVARHFGPG